MCMANTWNSWSVRVENNTWRYATNSFPKKKLVLFTASLVTTANNVDEVMKALKVTSGWSWAQIKTRLGQMDSWLSPIALSESFVKLHLFIVTNGTCRGTDGAHTSPHLLINFSNKRTPRSLTMTLTGVNLHEVQNLHQYSKNCPLYVRKEDIVR